MNERHVSQTARTAAAARAAHLIVDHEPVIFADTLAEVLLGDEAEQFIGYHRTHGSHPVLSAARAQVTYRSRYTEDCLAGAAGRGVAQYVILGAGLDSFAYRSPLASGVAVFEVDRPATQEWKRRRLAAAGVALPGNLAFVPSDFAGGSLRRDLRAHGFDPGRPAVVSWLGVLMYLSGGAIGGVLAELGGLAPGSELIADYMLPASLRDEAGESYVAQVAPAAEQWGEPWLTFMSPEQMSDLLRGHGFGSVTHRRQAEVGGPALWRRSDSLAPVSLSQLAHARIGAGMAR
jgi:methyltransferase (TIGR00027 family)